MNKNLATFGYIISLIWLGHGCILFRILDDSVSNWFVFWGILFLVYAQLVQFGEGNGRFASLPRATEQSHLWNLLVASIFLAVIYGLRLWLTGEATVYWFLFTLGMPIIIVITLYFNRPDRKDEN